MDSDQKRIVIIGATGLIGQELVKVLHSSDYSPIVLTRNTSKAKSLFSSNVRLERWNSMDVGMLASIINGSKAVVNLSGESIASRWTKKKMNLILESRINTTDTIVQAIKGCANPPEVFVQGSAIGYYSCNNSNRVDESALVGSGFLSQVVMQWEQAALRVENKSRLVIARTGIVLSANGGFFRKILLPYKLGFGGWFGDGSQMVSWIHIDDHVHAIQFLIENNVANGIYNLVSPEPIKYKFFAKQIGIILKRPVWMPIPILFIRLLFGTMADEVILSNQNIVPSRLISAGFKYKFSRIDNALEDLISK